MECDEFQGAKPPVPIPQLVIDAANVCWEFVSQSAGVVAPHTRPPAKGLLICFEYFRQLQVKAVAVCPRWWFENSDTTTYMECEDFDDLVALQHQGLLFGSPHDSHDDLFVIDYALQTNCFILSNDMYRDHTVLRSLSGTWLQERRISFMFVEHVFLPNVDAMQRFRDAIASQGPKDYGNIAQTEPLESDHQTVEEHQSHFDFVVLSSDALRYVGGYQMQRLKQLQQESGAQISRPVKFQLPPTAIVPEGFKFVLSGTEQSIVHAMYLLNDVIARFLNLNPQFNAQVVGVVQHIVLVPNSITGRLIGKKHQLRLEMCKQSGASIQYLQSLTSRLSFLGVQSQEQVSWCVITGHEHEAHVAKALVENKLNSALHSQRLDSTRMRGAEQMEVIEDVVLPMMASQQGESNTKSLIESQMVNLNPSVTTCHQEQLHPVTHQQHSYPVTHQQHSYPVTHQQHSYPVTHQQQSYPVTHQEQLNSTRSMAIKDSMHAENKPGSQEVRWATPDSITTSIPISASFSTAQDSDKVRQSCNPDSRNLPQQDNTCMDCHTLAPLNQTGVSNNMSSKEPDRGVPRISVLQRLGADQITFAAPDRIGSESNPTVTNQYTAEDTSVAPRRTSINSNTQCTLETQSTRAEFVNRDDATQAVESETLYPVSRNHSGSESSNKTGTVLTPLQRIASSVVATSNTVKWAASDSG